VDVDSRCSRTALEFDPVELRRLENSRLVDGAGSERRSLFSMTPALAGFISSKHSAPTIRMVESTPAKTNELKDVQ
jgi:hypothetical protein